MRAGVALLGLLVLLAPLPAAAGWVSARAERIFSPDTPEAEACAAAEERAKEDAIRQVSGERLASEDLMRCEERGEEASCTLNRSVWNTVDGDVRAVRNRRTETTALADGLRRCTVSLEAEIIVAKGVPDPSFDLGVTLNTSVFRQGEAMEIALTPNRPMSVAIFLWLPYESGEAQVTRVFPNSMDPSTTITGPATVPSAEGKRRYVMRVGFPDGQPATRRLVDEYLMVVATRQPVEWRGSYRLDEFRARLLELPRGDSRIVRRGYAVVRAP